ncbi:MAG: peptidylprolyl isomerase [Bacteroidota bacterium]
MQNRWVFSKTRRSLACILGSLVWLFAINGAIAQPSQGETLDRIIAVIGEEIILDSDVTNQYNYMVINGQKDMGNMRCEVMNQLVVGKLLLDKARQDSIVVSDEQVESELDRRLSYVIEQLGSEEEFEKIYGKSIAQFRQDTRREIEEGLLVDRMRGILLAEANITPREVREFFKTLDKDSLGFLPAEVEVNQIVIVPPFSETSKREAREELARIRKKIVEDGRDFGLMAIDNSDGPSGPRGGNLGEVRRSQMVPEFEEVIYNLREGEVSAVFMTEYGYHIAKLYKRRGEILEVSHILKIPSRSVNGDSVAIDSLNRIRARVLLDSITFERAAIRYSEDRGTKDCGGCITNPQTNELRVPMDKLDSDLFFKVDEMEEGEISKPMEYRMPDGSSAFHIIYLKKKIPPHVPNLKDDYKKIQRAALQVKQAEVFENWLESAKKNIYIDIKPTECANALKQWTN